MASYNVGVPVYASAWLSDTTFALGGGGGTSKTGIKNKLLIYSNDGIKLHETLLDASKDAPSTMCYNHQTRELCAGINSRSKINHAQTTDLDTFSYDATQGLVASTSYATLDVDTSTDPPYHKSSQLSPNATFLALGTSAGQFYLYSAPISDSPPLYSFTFNSEQVSDIFFDKQETFVAVCSSTAIGIWNLAEIGREGKPIQMISVPSLSSSAFKCTFRAAKFGIQSDLYTITNTESTLKTSRRKLNKKAAFLTRWISTRQSEWTPIKTVKVSDKPVTTFDISPDGKLIGLASSDLSISVRDTVSLKSLLKIKEAHDFPSTTLGFNPSGTVLLSASADATVRVIQMTNLNSGLNEWNPLIFLFLFFLVLLLVKSLL